MARVPGGSYAAFYPRRASSRSPVAPFWLDALPVTNAAVPRPSSRAEPLAALAGVAALRGATTLPLPLGGRSRARAERAAGRSRSTFVSWFAAAAYCAQPRQAAAERGGVGARRRAAGGGRGGAGRDAAAHPRVLRASARHAAARASAARRRTPTASATCTACCGSGSRTGTRRFAAGDGRSDRDARAGSRSAAAPRSAPPIPPTTRPSCASRSARASRRTYALHHLGFRCARSLS